MTNHTITSFAKSALRIIGYFLLVASGNPKLIACGIVLIGAELLGIIEELPGMYKGTVTGDQTQVLGTLVPPHLGPYEWIKDVNSKPRKRFI